MTVPSLLTALGGLALMIPDLPEDWEGRAFYLDLFKTMANAVKNCQREDGTWSMGLLGGVEGYPIIETSGTSFFVFGLAWGINQGLLDRATYEPVVFKAWKALEASVTPEGLLGHVQPVGAAPGDSYADKTEVYGIGAFLAAGSEVYRLVGGEVAQRNAASPKGEAPSIKKTAYARFVPERKDDLAWENDKVAFRMYGPALRNSKEDSGIDCWLKRVDYPIIDKWYRQNAEGKSYHKDHGEGYDPYHVGSSRGCGGLGLWIDGKMATSNTFVSYKIIQASGDACAFELVYEWKHGSDHYRETKAIRLKAGEHLFQSRSTFEKNGKPAANLPIAIGLTTHGGKAKTSHDLQEGWMACWEDFHGYGLGTGVAMDPKAIVEHKIIESKHKDEGHQLLITKTDQEGIVMYHAGFGWAKAGDITDMEKWQEVLRQY